MVCFSRISQPEAVIGENTRGGGFLGGKRSYKNKNSFIDFRLRLHENRDCRAKLRAVRPGRAATAFAGRRQQEFPVRGRSLLAV
jgi:hypothetical protein